MVWPRETNSSVHGSPRNIRLLHFLLFLSFFHCPLSPFSSLSLLPSLPPLPPSLPLYFPPSLPPSLTTSLPPSLLPSLPLPPSLPPLSLPPQLSVSAIWPLEVGRYTIPPPVVGKGKAKEHQEPVLSHHALAYLDLSPLLYPGATTVCGAFSLHPFSRSDMLAKVW